MKYKLTYGYSNYVADDYIVNELGLTYTEVLTTADIYDSYIILNEEEAILLKLKFPFIAPTQYEV